MAGKRKNIALLLEIGTARTSIAVTKFGPGKSYTILAQAQTPSLGVRKGIIVDISSFAWTVENLLASVREKFNIDFPAAVFALFSGTGIQIRDCPLRKDLGSHRLVSAGDVSDLLNKENEQGCPEGFVKLHILPLQWRLDGHVISSAEGKTGQKLEVDARLVMAGNKPVHSIYDAVRLAGMRVRQVVFSPLVQAPLLLNDAEMELGCILVDLGAETTTVASFKYANLRDAVVLPVGMDHVVGDLAVGLRTTMQAAGELLQSFSLSGERSEKYPSGYQEDFVFSIVYTRLEEICELIKQSIHSMNFTGFIAGGIKLTGGGAMFPGMAEFLSRRLELQVLPSSPYVSVPGLDKCSTSLAGLAGYCCQYEIPGSRHITDGFSGMLNKLRGILEGGLA